MPITAVKEVSALNNGELPDLFGADNTELVDLKTPSLKSEICCKTPEQLLAELVNFAKGGDISSDKYKELLNLYNHTLKEFNESPATVRLDSLESLVISHAAEKRIEERLKNTETPAEEAATLIKDLEKQELLSKKIADSIDYKPGSSNQQKSEAPESIQTQESHSQEASNKTAEIPDDIFGGSVEGQSAEGQPQTSPRLTLDCCLPEELRSGALNSNTENPVSSKSINVTGQTEVPSSGQPATGKFDHTLELKSEPTALNNFNEARVASSSEVQTNPPQHFSVNSSSLSSPGFASEVQNAYNIRPLIQHDVNASAAPAQQSPNIYQTRRPEDYRIAVQNVSAHHSFATPITPQNITNQQIYSQNPSVRLVPPQPQDLLHRLNSRPTERSYKVSSINNVQIRRELQKLFTAITSQKLSAVQLLSLRAQERLIRTAVGRFSYLLESNRVIPQKLLLLLSQTKPANFLNVISPAERQFLLKAFEIRVQQSIQKLSLIKQQLEMLKSMRGKVDPALAELLRKRQDMLQKRVDLIQKEINKLKSRISLLKYIDQLSTKPMNTANYKIYMLQQAMLRKRLEVLSNPALLNLHQQKRLLLSVKSMLKDLIKTVGSDGKIQLSQQLREHLALRIERVVRQMLNKAEVETINMVRLKRLNELLVLIREGKELSDRLLSELLMLVDGEASEVSEEMSAIKSRLKSQKVRRKQQKTRGLKLEETQKRIKPPIAIKAQAANVINLKTGNKITAATSVPSRSLDVVQSKEDDRNGSKKKLGHV